MFCKNCGANVADGEVFCPECGTKQDVAAQDSFVADTAPAADGAAAVVTKGGDKKKFAVIGGIVAAVVLILILIFSLGGGKSKELDFTLYYKDGNLWINYLSDNSTKKLSSDGGSDAIYCEANGYLFFLDDYDEGSYTLCYTDTTAKADKRTVEELVKGVGEDYTISKDGKIVYYQTDEDVLYAHNFKEKTKIAKDVSYPLFDDKGILAAYLEREEDDDGEVTYNLFSIDKKYEKTEVLKDIVDRHPVYDENDEVRGILVYANDTISVYEDGKLSTVKSSFSIDEDESFNIVYVDEKNNFYYTLGKGADGIDVDEIITDSTKDGDANVAMPDKYDSKYWVDPNAGSYWQTELTDEYLTDLKAYREKELRDDIREIVEEGITVDGISNDKLYYFNGKEDVELLANVAYADDIGDGIISYEKADTAENATVDIADLAKKIVKESDAEREFDEYSSYYASEWTLGEYITDLLATGTTKGVLVDNTACAIKTVNADSDEDEQMSFSAMDVRVDAEASAVYFTYDYDSEERTEILYKMKIKSKALGEAEKVYEGVYSYWFDDENNLYTARDPQIDKDSGNVETYTFYKGDNKIGEDVSLDVGRSRLETGEYLFGTDYSAKHRTYKLNMFDGKNVVAIADDVHSYSAMSAEKIFFIDDYDDGEGTLKLWTGAKDDIIEIDDGVASSFFPVVIEKK